jgi:Tfp pilus assembly protein PilO
MSSTNRLIGALLIVGILAVGFWMVLLSPKQKEANELSDQVEAQKSALVQAQSEASEALVARRQFPHDYQSLVVLGKAAPGSEETSSLIAQMNRVGAHSKVLFDSLKLTEGSGSGVEATTSVTAPEAGAAATELVPPTEAAASQMPLGASIGPAGLGVMPYELNFTGSFSHVAGFIHGIDSMVNTDKSKLTVDGRLATIDGFTLHESELGFPLLNASFTVTTYVVPPGQGITAGATPTAPASTETVEATPAAAATTPSEP